MRACILIRAKRGRAERVAERVGRLEGVTMARAVFGSADVVARAEASDFESLRQLVSRVGRTRGVLKSETLPELVVS